MKATGMSETVVSLVELNQKETVGSLVELNQRQWFR
jgi:hypothetical protein